MVLNALSDKYAVVQTRKAWGCVKSPQPLILRHQPPNNILFRIAILTDFAKQNWQNGDPEKFPFAAEGGINH